MRIGQRLDLAQFGHQSFIDGDPASGIENHHIKALQAGRLKRTLGNLCRRFAVGLGQHPDLGLFTKNTQLFTRCRACHIKRGEHHLLALFRAQAQCQLASGCCLARTLQARHQDDRWWIDRDIQRCCLAAQHIHQNVIDDLDDLLVGANRFQNLDTNRLFANPRHKAFDNRKSDIGIKQGKPHLAQRGINIRLAQCAPFAKSAKDVLEFVFQAVEHPVSGPLPLLCLLLRLHPSHQTC